MKKVSCITLVLILALAVFAVPASAGMKQFYFAIATDDENQVFYYSDIFDRDMSTYRSQPEDTEDFKASLFSDPGMHSGGIIRAKTWNDAKDKIQEYKDIYEGKGYSVRHKWWTP